VPRRDPSRARPARGSVFYTRLTAYATDLYPTLEEETGQATGFKITGGLSISDNQERFEELRRIASVGRATGIEAEIVGPAEIKAHAALLHTDDLAGGLWIPRDGQTDPTDTTMALARGARQMGARVFEGAPVRRILVDKGAVTGVETDAGPIDCETVVLCGGIWSRHLARAAGVTVPVQAAEHMYIVTEPMDEVALDQPFVRDFGAQLYIKGDAGKLVIGGFEPVARPWCAGGVPDDASFTQLPEDWDHFAFFMEGALKRVPALERAGIRQFMNGPEGFTPDNAPVMGEAPGVRNLFVAAGFNSSGIAGSGGAGKVIAEWVLDGQPEWDPWEADVRRFESWQGLDRFMYERTTESVGTVFAAHWPCKQVRTGRGVKASPFEARYRGMRACFGAVAGWERPMWFAPEGTEPAYDYTFGPQNWWPHAAEDVRATRERVALYDLTPFAKFVLQGTDAMRSLQLLCANDLDVPPGCVVYTQLLNPRGGIECDLTVTRTAEAEFRITTGAGARTHDLDWLRRNIPPEARVSLADVTSAEAVLGVMGPRSRDLLTAVSGADLSNAAFPFATSQEFEVGIAPARAQRVSFVGELGWEVFVPTEFAPAVFDLLDAAGRDLGLRHAGFHALDCCRMEKAFKHWGHDLSAYTTPLEAGLGFAVAFEKGVDFIGRAALLRQKEAGIGKRLVLFAIEEDTPVVLHDEPIYRDGELVGTTTSGNFAPTLGKCLAFGYVENPDGVGKDYILAGSYEIEIAARRYPATPALRAPYDPTGARMRG
jgi:4-methylaminobutanoate oxidase (formaldehyde-forming)